MARWKLAAPHYLMLAEPEQWEHRETDRNTGRPKIFKFNVPTLLDPTDHTRWTQRFSQGDGVVTFGDGMIVVCQPGKGQAGDIEFMGDPTPDMVPMDDEAKALSAKFADKWKHPIDSLPGSYADQVMLDLQAEVNKLRATQTQASTGQIEGLAELMAAMTTVMKQNAELIAKLANQAQPVQPSAVRRA